MATRIQVRRDTAANWAAAPTTVLASGEIGFESDTLQFKIGDGAAQWQNLEYAGGTTPIRQNASGTTITDLNAAALVNNGNAKYLILGADSVSNEPAGLTTATDGQLLVTVSKYDYLGTSAANERLLMTLTTLTTGKTYYRTYNGSWSSWYLVVTGDVSGNATVPGDLAVNGGDITTNQTTATVFNTTATTLNVGQAATTVSIGATTGTATIRNATTAISGAATVGSTLAVTGNTTLTGDLAVNGGDITTSAATATVFDSNATSVDIAGAATTLNIADAPTADQTINIGTGITASGATKTINIGTGGAVGSTTNINLGDSDGGTVVVNRALTVNGLTTLSGGLSLTGAIASSNLPSGNVVNFSIGTISAGAIYVGAGTNNPDSTSVTTSSYTPKLNNSTLYVIPLSTSGVNRNFGNNWAGTAIGTGDYERFGFGAWMLWCLQYSSGGSGSGAGLSNIAVSASGGGAVTVLGSSAGGLRAQSIGGNTWGDVSCIIQQASGNTTSRTWTITATVDHPGTNSNDAGVQLVKPAVVYVVVEVAP